MEYMDLGLKRPATIPIKIAEFIVMVIKVVMMVDVDICLKMPSTLHIVILEQ